MRKDKEIVKDDEGRVWVMVHNPKEGVSLLGFTVANPDHDKRITREQRASVKALING